MRKQGFKKDPSKTEFLLQETFISEARNAVPCDLWLEIDKNNSSLISLYNYFKVYNKILISFETMIF